MNPNKMKNTIKFLLFVFVLFQIPTDADAQILRRSLNKLGQKIVEKKVEKEVDKKTDEIADSIVRAMDKEEPMTEEEKKEAAENRRKAGSLIGSMMGGINKMDLPATFDFNHRIKMEMEDEKGDVSPMTMYVTEGSALMGYEMETDEKSTAFTVMDFDQEYMAVFTEDKGKKQAMSMPIPTDLIMSMAESEMEKQEKEEEFSIKKTGKTRTINGYACTEFIVTDEEYIQHIWITKDVTLKSGFFTIFSQMMKDKRRIENPLMKEGYPIEIEMIRKKNNKKSYVRTKEIKAMDYSFPASEYPYGY